MKLYHFNPNNYGQEFFVVAENRIDAHQHLLNYLKKKIEIEHGTFYTELYEQWSEYNPNSKKPFYGYTLDECQPGHVIQSEIV